MELQESFRKSLITGIALVAPLVITIVAFQFVFGWLSTFLGPLIEATKLVSYFQDVEILAEFLSVVIVFLAVAALGYLAQRSVGAWFFSTLDRLIGLVPLVRVIYTSVRQVSNALMQERTRYETVALIEYPRKGLYALGFITSESPDAVNDALGKPAVNVFMAKSPNPTAGELLLIPEEQIVELDISVSRAIRLLVTTGIAEEPKELEDLQDEIKRELRNQNIEMGEVLEERDEQSVVSQQPWGRSEGDAESEPMGSNTSEAPDEEE